MATDFCGASIGKQFVWVGRSPTVCAAVPQSCHSRLRGSRCGLRLAAVTVALDARLPIVRGQACAGMIHGYGYSVVSPRRMRHRQRNARATSVETCRTLSPRGVSVVCERRSGLLWLRWWLWHRHACHELARWRPHGGSLHLGRKWGLPRSGKRRLRSQ